MYFGEACQGRVPGNTLWEMTLHCLHPACRDESLPTAEHSAFFSLIVSAHQHPSVLLLNQYLLCTREINTSMHSLFIYLVLILIPVG